MLLGLAPAHAAPPAPEQVASTLPVPVLAVQDHSGGGLEVTLTAPGLSDESAADLPPDWPDEAIVATSHDDSRCTSAASWTRRSRAWRSVSRRAWPCGSRPLPARPT